MGQQAFANFIGRAAVPILRRLQHKCVEMDGPWNMRLLVFLWHPKGDMTDLVPFYGFIPHLARK